MALIFGESTNIIYGASLDLASGVNIVFYRINSIAPSGNPIEWQYQMPSLGFAGAGKPFGFLDLSLLNNGQNIVTMLFKL